MPYSHGSFRYTRRLVHIDAQPFLVGNRLSASSAMQDGRVQQVVQRMSTEAGSRQRSYPVIVEAYGRYYDRPYDRDDVKEMLPILPSDILHFLHDVVPAGVEIRCHIPATASIKQLLAETTQTAIASPILPHACIVHAHQIYPCCNAGRSTATE